MNTLIVYGTRYGLTERCAKSLAGKLSGKIQLVNIENQPVNNISEYDRVIIAASVYLGKIQKSIIKFCDKNYSEILNKRIGIFICCCNQEKASRYLEKSFTQEMLRRAWAKECFGGQININQLTFFEKLLVKLDKEMRKTEILVDNIKKFADVLEGDEPPEVHEPISNEVEESTVDMEEFLEEVNEEVDEGLEYEQDNVEEEGNLRYD